MKKRIRKYMMLLVVITLLTTSTAIISLIHQSNRNTQIGDVQNVANNTALELNKTGDKLNGLNTVSSSVKTMRFSLIEADGTVVFDSATDIKGLDNHNDRKEVIEARNQGYGDYERHSDSLDSVYYYYAVELENGSILRVSKASNSMFAVVKSVIPFIILELIVISIVSAWITKKLTHKIVKPIEEESVLGTLNSPYVELDAYFQNMRDQRIQIEEQVSLLKEQYSTMETILDSMYEGFMIVDEDGSVLLANASSKDILDVHDVEGKAIQLLLKDYELFSRGANEHSVYQRNHKVYKVYVSEKMIGSKKVSTVLLIDNTSEEYAKKQREEFSANVTHELKTPLTTIKGLGELQAAGFVEDKDIQLFGSKIVNQSNRLIQLIEQTIQLSKFDEAQIKENFEEVELSKVISRVVGLLEEKAKQKGISIQLQCDDVTMDANEKMLDEMLFNLLDNAISYSDEGGDVILSVKQAEQVEIEVMNHGEMIPDEALPRLFERYFRVDESRSKKSGGTGLGLSIVKHIVEFHKGTVSVDNKGYTRFRILLPNEQK